MLPHLSEEEDSRLEALRDCRVLDAPPEELFDQTARFAAYLCRTPIGLIGFIDATRLWFKARVGWEYPEIPREDSICGQTILQPEVLVIPDAAMDERFFGGPMVTHAGIRFYAGVPVLTRDGYAGRTVACRDVVSGLSRVAGRVPQTCSGEVRGIGAFLGRCAGRC